MASDSIIYYAKNILEDAWGGGCSGGTVSALRIPNGI